ncbi:MAG: c-type cytochrome [Aureispira sp.]|nr:c-type cytochrome [Aureispira sp.]
MKTFFWTKWIVVIGILAPMLISFQQSDLSVEEQLGKELFFDPLLSQDQSISCSSCHKPEFAFADNVALSEGLFGQETARNTPSAMNLGSYTSFSWDGRAKTLEQQSLNPIQDHAEMGMPVQEAITRLVQSEHYNAEFRAIYGNIPTKENLGKALATYQRTLSTKSAYDRYSAGDESALSDQAKRGLELFGGKGKCVNCHMGNDFTSGEFENIGTYDGQTYNDKGRANYTKDSGDNGKFKVPSLRNVAVTAPYMHDGSISNLKDVVEYYNNSEAMRPHGIGRDELLLEPLGLSSSEVDDLVAFMEEALTGDDYIK